MIFNSIDFAIFLPNALAHRKIAKSLFDIIFR
jgi:hypothetical protein